MKKILIITIVFIATLSNLFSQIFEYEKFFELGENIQSESLTLLNNGDYLISGTLNANSQELSMICSVILNQNGTSTDTILYSSEKGIHLRSTIQDSDNFIYHLASTKDSIDNYLIVVLKTTSEGNLIWMKTHQVQNNNSPSEIIVSADSNLIITGSTYNESFSNRRAFFLKLNTDGEILKSSLIGSASTENVGLDIVELSSGNLYISGWKGSGNTSGYLISVNSDGEVLDDQLNFSSNSAIFTSIIKSTNESILIGGFSKNSQRSPTLTKANYFGDLIWEKEFDDADNFSWGSKIIENSNNEIYLGAYSHQVNNDINIWLLKIDSIGNEISRNFYGETNANSIRDIQFLENNAIGILGQSNTPIDTFPSFVETQMHFIKLHEEQPSNTWKVNSKLEVDIYPNPCSNNLYIRTKEDNQISSLKIISNLGEILSYNKIERPFTYLDLTHLNNGIYFLRFYHEEEFLGYEKLVIQNIYR